METIGKIQNRNPGSSSEETSCLVKSQQCLNPAKHLARVFAALLAAVPFLVNLIPVLLLGTVLTRFLELFTRIYGFGGGSP